MKSQRSKYTRPLLFFRTPLHRCVCFALQYEKIFIDSSFPLSLNEFVLLRQTRQQLRNDATLPAATLRSARCQIERNDASHARGHLIRRQVQIGHALKKAHCLSFAQNFLGSKLGPTEGSSPSAPLHKSIPKLLCRIFNRFGETKALRTGHRALEQASRSHCAGGYAEATHVAFFGASLLH